MSNTAVKIASSRIVKLNSSTLSQLSAEVSVPRYNRKTLKSGIVHIGVGGFHRAHQALYIDDLLNSGLGGDWAICGVGLLPQDKTMRDVMKSQDCLYTVVERGNSGDAARVVGSIIEYLWAPENPQAVLEKLCSPEVRIVSLTITEGGYCFNQGTGEFDATNAGLQKDLKSPATPTTAFGFIVEALNRRRQKGVAPFTILSCDNLQSNGQVARKMITAFAKLRDQELASWIEQNVAFPNSMVDRITPATTEDDRSLVRDRFGVEDGWPVACEPFRQWVIEDKFCNGRPEVEKVGAQMTPDVHPYEKMKIRLLNASHSAMGYLGYLAGFKYIYEIAQDSEFQKYVTNMMNEEVTPLLDPVPGVDLTQYKRTLIERFSNINVKDQASRICMDGSAKMPKFILPSISERLESGASIRRLALCVASWFRYLSGADEKGEKIEIVDPIAAKLNDFAKQGGTTPEKLLSMSDIFSKQLTSSKIFVDEVAVAMKSLYEQGARATLKKYI